MNRVQMNVSRLQKGFLLVIVTLITIAFFVLVHDFLLTVLLAALTAGLFQPVYLWFLRKLGGRRGLAASLTLGLGLVVVVVPLLLLLGIVANQALTVSENVKPRLEELLAQQTTADEIFAKVPFHTYIEPYRGQILTKAGELVGNLGTFAFSGLTALTAGTVAFFFYFFVYLYTVFFLLLDGRQLLQSALACLPLSEDSKAQMLARFMSVTRATLKGTFLVGLVQGTLSGLAFAVAGINGPIFWGAVMTVLSVIPGVGGALIWVPAVIVLLAIGHVLQGLLLFAFCAFVVGTVDNVLRPMLVGRDIGMHDLMIFFSTLGGLALFGASGFILGPIIAALFLTIWSIFASSFNRGPSRPVPPETQEG